MSAAKSEAASIAPAFAPEAAAVAAGAIIELKCQFPILLDLSDPSVLHIPDSKSLLFRWVFSSEIFLVGRDGVDQNRFFRFFLSGLERVGGRESFTSKPGGNARSLGGGERIEERRGEGGRGFDREKVEGIRWSESF